jgi:hypothetical protein
MSYYFNRFNLREPAEGRSLDPKTRELVASLQARDSYRGKDEG